MGWLETIVLGVVLLAAGLYLLLAVAIVVTAMVERRPLKYLAPAGQDDPEWQKLGSIASAQCAWICDFRLQSLYRARVVLFRRVADQRSRPARICRLRPVQTFRRRDLQDLRCADGFSFSRDPRRGSMGNDRGDPKRGMRALLGARGWAIPRHVGTPDGHAGSGVLRRCRAPRRRLRPARRPPRAAATGLQPKCQAILAGESSRAIRIDPREPSTVLDRKRRRVLDRSRADRVPLNPQGGAEDVRPDVLDQARRPELVERDGSVKTVLQRRV